ncbi:MAG: hypothetical protein MJ197_09710 [Bacteroidales bacterium]|nr:hypothetical protein [Bacteroidales bacterium]
MGNFEKKVIDISHWQGEIDFDKVKNDGVYGVIIKCGGNELKGRRCYTDPNFVKYYHECKRVGLHVGTYFFCGVPNDEHDGEKDADYLYSLIRGYQFDMPVYFDFEVGGKSDQERKLYSNYLYNACRRMEEHGYFSGIYASDISGFKDRLIAPRLLPFSWWVARYSTTGVQYAKVNCHMWQCSSTGHIDGIKGNVDIDVLYVDFPGIITKKGLNGYEKNNVHN